MSIVYAKEKKTMILCDLFRIARAPREETPNNIEPRKLFLENHFLSVIVCWWVFSLSLSLTHTLFYFLMQLRLLFPQEEVHLSARAITMIKLRDL